MIVVTGLLRSGTSAVAQMLHQGGVLMGTTQLMPVLGGLHEWEDHPMQHATCQWLLAGPEPEPEERIGFFTEYIQSRSDDFHRKAEQMNPGVLIDWGVKTPFLAPYLREFEQAAREMQQKVVFVITERAFSDTMKSLESRIALYREPLRSHFTEKMQAVQSRIASALAERLEPRIEIQDLWMRPLQAAIALRRLNPSFDLGAMVHGIGQEFL